jgi:predicted nucleic acid-binding protein
MDYVDSSVAVKWFKADEAGREEALALLENARSQKTELVASEWLPLEVVRALVKAGAPKDAIEKCRFVLKEYFSCGIIKKTAVSEVLEHALDLEIELNLHAADAVHLATALSTGSEILWTEDEHLHKAGVRKYCRQRGMEINRVG